MRKAKPKVDDTVTIGSANVFADLGLRNPDQLLAKARLVDAVTAVIRDRGLTQQRTAEVVGLTQPKISALLNGDTKGFSCDRLMRILTLLGHDVSITVAPAKNRRRGLIRVMHERLPTAGEGR